jgi:membrane associated rhomboid family serine protease
MSEKPCAFHPDRLTAVSCARCERPICTDDMISAAVGFQCPVCAGLMREGALGESAYRMRVRAERWPFARMLAGAQVTTLIVAANVVVMLLMLLAGGFTSRNLLRFGAMTAPLPAGQWWRMVTAMFVHVGVFHIMFNMFALMLFGGAIEQRYGKARFLALYFGAGVLGSAMSLAFTGAGLRAGASGGIFGVMGAWLALAIYNRNSPAMRGQLRSWTFLIGLNLAFSVAYPGVDLHAHLGGLVGGFAIAGALEISRAQKGPARAAVALAGYAAVAVASYLLAAPHLI